jgi:hypothetical protein
MSYTVRECESSMKPRIVIFGAGKGGERAYSFLGRRYTVVAFSDNNSSLHGNKLKSMPIVSPKGIRDLSPERICIASRYSMEIFVQLNYDLGWDAEKLEIVNNAVLNGRTHSSWWWIPIVAISGLFLLYLCRLIGLW